MPKALNAQGPCGVFEAMDIACKGLNAFSVLFTHILIIPLLASTLDQQNLISLAAVDEYQPACMHAR
jgi:hypothetical protein